MDTRGTRRPGAAGPALAFALFSSLAAHGMDYRAVFTEPPRKIPSDSSVDAPLLGNGDLLAALGGGPARLQFYINKNDLWVMSAQDGSRPQPLARLDLDIPALQGATYRVEQELSRAVTTGRFEKDGVRLALEAGVAATENLLWIRLSAEGGPLRGRALLHLPGAGGDAAAGALSGGSGRVQLGREQYGGGRWYLDGALDEVAVYGRALQPEEITALAGKARLAEGLLREWDFEQATNAVPGVRGRAVDLDGKNAFIDSAPLKPGKGVTVSAFVKLRSHAAEGTAQYILSQGEWNKDWSLGLSGGRLRMAVGGAFAQSPQPIPLNQWVHVAGTYDGVALRVFVDGVDPHGAPPEEVVRAGDVQVVERRFEQDVQTPAGAACAVRVVGGGEAFTVEPGKPVLIVAAVRSRFDQADFRAGAVKRAAGFTADELAALRQAHEAWWRDFWGKSFVEIPDKVLEQRYYLSHYVMACASRVYDFPPGLFGWVTTDRPAWNGDYHMNYNHVAPFYGLYVANHIAQADPCHGPILANAEQARELCRKTLGVEGIFQYVGIGPKGSIAGATALMQKSNSSYSCVPLAFRWYATYDLDYARQAYPFVRDTALFWENWLKFETNRYVIYKDAVHEGSGDNVNPIVSLAFVRMVMNLALDLSRELGVDAARHEKWAHIRDHISPYPACRLGDLQHWWPAHLPRTDENRNLPIFRYTEQGTEWWGDNTVGIQHIYPAGGIGLDSPPELLERARNQLRVMNRWVDFNGMNSFYAAAARVGYDPAVILKEMRAMLGRLAGPNGMIPGNPHGMEHQSIVPNAIQEMLLQSHEGVIRFFPCWPRELDARFGTLRARGAFLVSAELKGGAVAGVTIVSEKGRDCTVQNPWPGRKVKLSGREVLTGERFTFKTKPGATIALVPE